MAGKDQMVEDRKIECLGGAGELAGRATVGVARTSVAAGVVVGQDHPAAAKPRRVGDDIPDGHADGFGLAFIAFDMQAASCVIDMGDPELLTHIHSSIETGREEAPGRVVAIEPGRGFGTLMVHGNWL